MTRVLWTKPALTDLEDIQDYVATDSPTAAYVLVNDILERTERFLSDNPGIGRIGRVQGTCELVLSTPYIIAYRMTDTVEILAVVHGARQWPDEFE